MKAKKIIFKVSDVLLMDAEEIVAIALSPIWIPMVLFEAVFLTLPRWIIRKIRDWAREGYD